MHIGTFEAFAKISVKFENTKMFFKIDFCLAFCPSVIPFSIQLQSIICVFAFWGINKLLRQELGLAEWSYLAKCH